MLAEEAENANLKLLATCALICNRVSACNADTTSMSKVLLTKALVHHFDFEQKNISSDMSMTQRIKRNHKCANTDLLEAFRPNIHKSDTTRTLFNDEGRYYNNIRYKPFNGRGVCRICGKTVALTRKGDLRLHNCKLVRV